MTATITEADQLANLDWHPACQLSKCQANHPPATHEFSWRITVCRHQGAALCCNHCAERKQASINTATKVVCPGCHREYPAVLCDYKITPLGRPE